MPKIIQEWSICVFCHGKGYGENIYTSEGNVTGLCPWCKGEGGSINNRPMQTKGEIRREKRAVSFSFGSYLYMIFFGKCFFYGWMIVGWMILTISLILAK